jgi:hypothetical protein
MVEARFPQLLLSGHARSSAVQGSFMGWMNPRQTEHRTVWNA